MSYNKLQWTPEIEVGIPEIDNQHKIFFEYVGFLINQSSKDLSKEKITKYIKNTRDFAVKHFNAEEKIMEDYNYPLYEEHKKKHKEILKLLMDYVQKTKEEEINQKILTEFAYTLVDCFAKQTLTDDKKLVKFLKEDEEIRSKVSDLLKGYFSN